MQTKLTRNLRFVTLEVQSYYHITINRIKIAGKALLLTSQLGIIEDQNYSMVINFMELKLICGQLDAFSLKCLQNLNWKTKSTQIKNHLHSLGVTVTYTN